MEQDLPLSIHDDSFSEADVLLNLTLPVLSNFVEGDMAHLSANTDPVIGDADSQGRMKRESRSLKVAGYDKPEISSPLKPGEDGLDSKANRFEHRPLDGTRGYFFIVKDVPADARTKLNTAQVRWR